VVGRVVGGVVGGCSPGGSAGGGGRPGGGGGGGGGSGLVRAPGESWAMRNRPGPIWLWSGPVKFATGTLERVLDMKSWKMRAG